MNTSADEVGVVPSGVVTVTSTGPAAWLGTYTSISVSEMTKNPEAGVVPNRTVLAPVRSLPLISVADPVVGHESATDQVMEGEGVRRSSSFSSVGRNDRERGAAWASGAGRKSLASGCRTEMDYIVSAL